MKTTMGFSLIELAMVIFIMSLVLGNFLVPLASQIDIQRTKVTEQRLEKIKEALLGFAIINQRLPCPDTTNYPNSPHSDGFEDQSSTCLEGWLPWATLGTEAYDAWGRLFRYRVAEKYSTSITPETSSNLLIIDVLETWGNPFQFTNNTNTRVAAIIFSVGKNQIADGENNSLDNTYIKNNRKTSTLTNPDVDDIITWISAYTIANRLIKAGKWP